MLIDEIIHAEPDGGEGLLAIILRSEPPGEAGVRFLTDPDNGLQLGILCHQAGKVIPAHIHERHGRYVAETQECLFVRRGQVKLSLFTSDGELVANRLLFSGDVALLLQGGHSLEVLADCEIVECKQGPYLGPNDKRFLPRTPEIPGWRQPK